MCLFHLAASATFPVIVYSHGLGGMRTCYSATACDLASHGYVVACVEHRYCIVQSGGSYPISLSLRDASACVTLQRVPKSGREKGELEDHWLKFYHVAEGEKEFPLRMKQVNFKPAIMEQFCWHVLHYSVVTQKPVIPVESLSIPSNQIICKIKRIIIMLPSYATKSLRVWLVLYSVTWFHH